ncbi:MAG: YraN family protein [Planctomycetes bacterium]|nr:YraN family protein [Planctomycetota bacterium]
MLPTLLFGHQQERLAARFLKRQGLRILGRNVRVGRDELDLVARDGGVAVVVEVRYRKRDRVAADLSIDHRKIACLRRAWYRLARDLHLPPRTPVRFDLVLTSADGSLSWHRGVV